jgi:UDP-glucose 4-epimerase
VDVLVTGGAGFIGSHVCRSLRVSGSGGRILVLDDFSTGLESNLAGIDGVDVHRGSVLDESLVTELVSEVDAVVHLAAVPAVARSLQNPRASHDANATGTVVVLEAARLHSRYVVVASSSSVYGRNASLPTSEDHPTRPASPYVASKLAAESYTMSYMRSFGTKVLALRFFNVFGPYQRAGHAYAAVIPAFIAAALDGKPLSVHGDGTQTRDFTYVGDVIAVITDALRREVTTDSPVNLAFSSNTSLLDLIAELEVLLARPIELSHGPSRGGDVHDSQADCTRLQALFPSIRPTPLTEGLQSTVDWFRQLEGDDSVSAAVGAPA